MKKKQTLIYISDSPIPSRYANGVQVMNMCQAFLESGYSVTLLTPDCVDPEYRDVNPHDFYGVNPEIKITRLPFYKITGGAQCYAWSVRNYVRKALPDLVYGRFLYGVYWAAQSGFDAIFETHILPVAFVQKWYMKRLFQLDSVLSIGFITRALKDLYTGLFPGLLKKKKTTIIPDGARIPGNSHKTHKTVKKIGYFGQLVPGRGISVIKELAGKMPSLDFYLYGGTSSDILRIKNKSLLTNLHIEGFIPPSHIAHEIARMDIVLLPYQEKVYLNRNNTLETSRWMSPMKLFEYMANGVPIISSDIPVLREILINGENALLVSPSDIDSWEKTIIELIHNLPLREKLARNAYNDICEKYSWGRRVERILNASGLVSSDYVSVNCPVCNEEDKGRIVFSLTVEDFSPQWVKNLKFAGISPVQRFFLRKCRICGCIRVNPQLESSLSEKLYLDIKKTKTVPNERNLENKYYQAHRILESIRDCFDGEAFSLIDYGCGFGSLLKVADEKGILAAGLDIDPVRLAYCEKQGYSVQKLNETVLINESGKWDSACLNQVLEHVQDPGAVLRDITVLLRPGGVVFIGVPSARHIKREKKSRQFEQVNLLEHLNYFTISSLDTLCKRYGLRPLSSAVLQPVIRTPVTYLRKKIKKTVNLFFPKRTPLWINRMYQYD